MLVLRRLNKVWMSAHKHPVVMSPCIMMWPCIIMYIVGLRRRKVDEGKWVVWVGRIQDAIGVDEEGVWGS